MITEALPQQQQIIHLISQIQCEDIRRAREQRENNRQNISLPVKIKSLDCDRCSSAISRDISSQGIGLISAQRIQPGTDCELDLRLASSTSSVIAHCLWCHDFGDDFYLSGWKFVQERVTPDREQVRNCRNR